jgi:hypothetical protein
MFEVININKTLRKSIASSLLRLDVNIVFEMPDTVFPALLSIGGYPVSAWLMKLAQRLR